jgi:glycosyltransferase involved in cell wall biosynthesis
VCRGSVGNVNMRIVFWQNILSPHQSAAIRALAETGHDVELVACEEMSSDRSGNGWSRPDLGPTRVSIAPSDAEIRKLCRSRAGNSVHILGGAHWTPLGAAAMRECFAADARFGLLSETADPDGWKGAARWLKWTAERLVRGRRLDFILAIGHVGVDWYRRCGYPARTIFPYGYVTETPRRQERDFTPRNELHLVYVGRTTAGKGVDLLLRCLGQLRGQPWKLAVIGDGPQRPFLEELANQYGVSERIAWHGMLPNDAAMHELCKQDLLILPSTHKDGWGAVVNEALMRGVPVVCSDRCGAADLVGQPWRGGIFRSGDGTASNGSWPNGSIAGRARWNPLRESVPGRGVLKGQPSPNICWTFSITFMTAFHAPCRRGQFNVTTRPEISALRSPLRLPARSSNST